MSMQTDDEARTTTASSGPSEAPSARAVLTVLCHPDPGRIGDRLTLRALSIHQEVLISRSEPTFGPPEPESGIESPAGRPLGGRFLSRQPLRLRPAGEPGGIVIDPTTTRTHVTVDGEEIEQPRLVSSQQIAEGVVLCLGYKLVLLLHQEARRAKREEKGSSFGLIGEGSAMRRLRREIRKLSPLPVPVLLRGETGTGKELVARALHDESSRRNGPFVAVNMAMLGPSLAAAALFGAERGAYTGSDRKRAGHFRKAHGGTLFLDEIGEAPTEVQVMLLRALETREIQPIGSTETVEVDVRIVAATDARLEEAMASGGFKMPLYHRLAGYTVTLPALRERREDLGRLLYFFLREELGKLGQPALEVDARPWPPAELVVRLAQHTWPGNVRELRNVARQLAIAGREGTIPEFRLLLPPAPSAEALGPGGIVTSATPPASAAGIATSKRRTLRKLEDVREEELQEALRENRWQIQATADALAVSRPNLYRLMEASASVRTANELEFDEIRSALDAAGGDPEAAALALEVSELGLKRRMKALGFDID